MEYKPHDDYNEDDDMDYENKDQFKQYISFSYFQDNNLTSWDWKQYCTIRQPARGEPRLPTTVIGKNMFPKTGEVTDDWAIQELKRIGSRDRSKSSVDKMKKDITFWITKIRDTMRKWFLQFFVDFANIEGFRYIGTDGHERQISSKEELDVVIDNLTSKERVYRFLFILYIVFDYMPTYTSQITKYVMLQHSLSFDTNEIRKEERTVEMSRKN
jgi:hypothetical protein